MLYSNVTIFLTLHLLSTEARNAALERDVQFPTITDWHGGTLSLVTNVIEHVTGTVEEGILQGDKLVERTIRDMQLMSNFTVVLKKLDASDIDFNKEYFQGGVGARLSSGEADVAIGYYYVTPARVNEWSPLLPLLADRLYAYFEQPKAGSIRNIFMVPLKPEVTIAYLATVAIFGVLVTGFKSTTKGKFGVIEILFYTVAMTTQKTHSHHVPSSFRINVLVLTTGVLSLLIYSFYSSKLLNVLKARTQLDSVEQLVHHDFIFHAKAAVASMIGEKDGGPKLRVIHDAVDFAREFFRVVKSAGRHAYVTVDITSPNSGNLLGKYREHLVSSKVGRNPDKEICKSMSSVRIQKTGLSLAGAFYVKKNSPLREFLNRDLVRIQETGLLKRYLKYTANGTLYCNDDETYIDDLGMGDVSSAFILAAVFYGFAVTVFVWEAYTRRW